MQNAECKMQNDIFTLRFAKNSNRFATGKTPQFCIMHLKNRRFFIYDSINIYNKIEHGIDGFGL